jgi:hypothetical protein
MSNKTRLQTNNTNLQALINKANTLPDAGSGGSSGGSVETCTVIFNYVTSAMMELQAIAYIGLGTSGPELKSIQPSVIENYTITLENVVCNSIIVVYFEPMSPINEVSSNIVNLYSVIGFALSGAEVFEILGDGTITLTNNW